MSRRDIVNHAIVLLGKERIVSLEDNRPEVHVALDFLNDAIDFCLLDDLWGFGTRFIRLVESGSQETNRPGYTRFELPDNFLMVVEIWHGGLGEGGIERDYSGYLRSKVEDYVVRGRDLLIKDTELVYYTPKCDSTDPLECEQQEPVIDLTLEYTFKKRDQFDGQFNLYCGYFLAGLMGGSFGVSADYLKLLESKAASVQARVASRQGRLKGYKRKSPLHDSRFV